MTNTMLALVMLIVALTVVVGGGAHVALRGVRARRRVAWELERVEWRRWMTRP